MYNLRFEISNLKLPKVEQKQLNREQLITLAKKSTFLIEAE